ncbi:MAG: DNA-3-methyladenine glycosylase [Gemmatimonadota bacterium]
MAGAAQSARRRRTPGVILLPRFYARETELVARELLGCILECRGRTGVVSGRIVETEAYLGEHDPACHAAAGRTPRTETLYGPPGTFYVYFVYGTHWCCNAVTRPAGLPSAVLIRALEPLSGVDLMWARRARARRDADLTSGPGKVCAALAIDGRHNGLALQRGTVTIRSGTPVPDRDVAVTPRIGINETNAALDWPLRWCVAGSPFLSRRVATPHR